MNLEKSVKSSKSTFLRTWFAAVFLFVCAAVYAQDTINVQKFVSFNPQDTITAQELELLKAIDATNATNTTNIQKNDWYPKEIMPEFPDGEEALKKFLSDNIKYHQAASDLGIEGTVLLRFVVRSDGKISDITVQKSPHELLSEEAIRVVKKMPKWKPGKQCGVAVHVYFILPINFELKKDN